MAKKRAFFSFDFDEDQNLKHHMVGQMKLLSSPFEGADWSMKEAAPERNWEQEAEARIGRSDVVVVLVGPKTHKAPGVLKEVAIYTPSGKTYRQRMSIATPFQGSLFANDFILRIYRWNARLEGDRRW